MALEHKIDVKEIKAALGLVLPLIKALSKEKRAKNLCDLLRNQFNFIDLGFLIMELFSKEEKTRFKAYKSLLFERSSKNFDFLEGFLNKGIIKNLISL